ncbi:MAG: hypothetical protein Q7J98_01595 [Kiritimatiellia bacterium]|nr:hypothetical protein [Kiritimatiellia bacterium]
MKTQTKAQALAQGITLRRWRNMRYRTARGQQCLAAYRRNADRASKIHKNRHRDFSVIQPEPITPALARILNYAPIRPTPASLADKRELKALKLKIRQLKIEQHCAQMRDIHSANAAARRSTKAMIKL